MAANYFKKQESRTRRGIIMSKKTCKNFIDAIQHQSFFDIKEGSIVDVDYFRIFSDGNWYRSEKYAGFPAFHQRKPIILGDGTERHCDVVWIWSGNATFGKNREAFVPVRESNDVHDIFRHTNQDDLDFTTVIKVWRHPLDKDDPSKGEFFQIVGKDFPVEEDDEDESFRLR